MTPAVSVVMPTLDRRDTLAHVLPSLARQSYPASALEILLCDSGSVDGTAELVADLGLSNLRLLRGENRGRSGARNRGILDATGEIVLFTDADIVADEHLVAEHARAHQEERDVAVVGCEVQVDSLEDLRRAMADPFARRHLHSPNRRTLSWLFFLTGNASVRRDDLARAGLFDERFTGYGHEDLDLGYRLSKLGLTIRYRPSAINYHWHPLTFEERCRKMRMAGESTVRLYLKHRDWRIRLLLGANPLSLFCFGSLADHGRVLRWCGRRRDRSAICREIVLQHAYVSGIRAALARPEVA